MRLMDADALIAEYGDWYTEEGTEEGYIGTVKGIVDGMPTIEERKKGKWIYHDDDDWRFDTYHCSECRNIITVDSERRDDIGFTIDDMKWCNNCGADMRGEGGPDG